MTPGQVGATPRQRIELECARRGKAAVVAGCIRLLEGGPADPAFVLVLGGQPAHAVLDGRDKPYWLRVWAARGLLWAWDDAALPALAGALADESWRVRELAAKVVARHRLEDALPAVARLRDDPVRRVRRAAERALEVTSVIGSGRAGPT